MTYAISISNAYIPVLLIAEKGGFHSYLKCRAWDRPKTDFFTPKDETTKARPQKVTQGAGLSAGDPKTSLRVSWALRPRDEPSPDFPRFTVPRPSPPSHGSHGLPPSAPPPAGGPQLPAAPGLQGLPWVPFLSSGGKALPLECKATLCGTKQMAPAHFWGASDSKRVCTFSFC